MHGNRAERQDTCRFLIVPPLSDAVDDGRVDRGPAALTLTVQLAGAECPKSLPAKSRSARAMTIPAQVECRSKVRKDGGGVHRVAMRPAYVAFVI